MAEILQISRLTGISTALTVTSEETPLANSRRLWPSLNALRLPLIL
jgi:hypothetical protein